MPIIVRTTIKVNHGYNINTVIRATRKIDRYSYISHSKLLTCVSAKDKSVEKRFKILPDGLVSKNSTGLRQSYSNILWCIFRLAWSTPDKFPIYFIILLTYPITQSPPIIPKIYNISSYILMIYTWSIIRIEQRDIS